ncbi:hypothetical protein PSH12_01555 [Enterococcus casseliflavus]|uniref:hypothetical protein n=1 Tax=Enterococcus casseliflavus TaxID=37734 RepID=UPI002954FF1B|nr:hypothetical protein [Enterococcus casseliflavus]MDV7711289.1 hypothetical protein [Enterococcus casseliflavus]
MAFRFTNINVTYDQNDEVLYYSIQVDNSSGNNDGAINASLTFTPEELDLSEVTNKAKEKLAKLASEK